MWIINSLLKSFNKQVEIKPEKEFHLVNVNELVNNLVIVNGWTTSLSLYDLHDVPKVFVKLFLIIFTDRAHMLGVLSFSFLFSC